MGQVIRFSEFDKYLAAKRRNGDPVEGTILDANVIITLNYEPKRFHTRTYEFVRNKLQRQNIALYSTVNTTQEYLEFYRRLLLTEGLRTAIQPESGFRELPTKKRQAIRAQSSILQARELHQGAEPVFNDRELKKIREVFFQSDKAGRTLWRGLCAYYLKQQLHLEFRALQRLNVTYLSMHKDDVKVLFNKVTSWDDAIDVCADIGVGFSDAMILNALQATTLPFVVSLDRDLAHSVMANPSLKDVVMPDEVVDQFSVA